jgi:hypothetical protein
MKQIAAKNCGQDQPENHRYPGRTETGLHNFKLHRASPVCGASQNLFRFD